MSKFFASFIYYKDENNLDSLAHRHRIGCILALLLVSVWMETGSAQNTRQSVELVVLGIAQDAGIPHAGCKRSCCVDKWNQPELQRHAVSLGIIDHQSKQYWMVEATPDFKWQHQYINSLVDSNYSFSGILLTHAHVGHYSGLIHLGKEVMGTKGIPVYAMPKMHHFLNDNGPWDQLIALNNIELKELQNERQTDLSDLVDIMPLVVPHRDEYSETVGFKISGPNKTVLFIPDIDKWHLWEKDIKEVIHGVDIAFIDGTFYANFELPYRDMSLIPHPFVSESMELFDPLSIQFKDKVYFIHFNHTNPIVNPDGKIKSMVEDKGYHCAEEELKFGL